MNMRGFISFGRIKEEVIRAYVCEYWHFNMPHFGFFVLDRLDSLTWATGIVSILFFGKNGSTKPATRIAISDKMLIAAPAT